MAEYLRAQVTLQRDGALPEDSVVNTYHFAGVGDAPATAAANVSTRLQTFYAAIQGYLSENVAATGHTVKVYNLLDAKPRQPLVTNTFGLTITAGTPLPSEVALCLSMKAAVISGDNPRRKRGRVYLGPFASSALLGTQEGGDRIVLDSTRTGILTAAEAMAASGANPRLSVFSETIAGAEPYSAFELDLAFGDVTELYIDNRYDIIRKRGARPTSRITQAVTA